MNLTTVIPLKGSNDKRQSALRTSFAIAAGSFASGRKDEFEINHEYDQGSGPQGKGDTAGAQNSAAVFDEFEAQRADKYRGSCQYNRHADHRKPIQDFKKLCH